MANALDLLREMKNAKCIPNTITYSSAISACGKAGGEIGMKNALALLREMKEANLLNRKLGTLNTLDLHENNFFSRHTWNKIVKRDSTRSTHIPGIHPSLARIYLLDIIQSNGSLPSTIIVGQHGHDSLKNTVINTLSNHGVMVSSDESNKGLLIIDAA